MKKALYGLKQSPKAWCERLITYLLEKKFEKWRVDRTLFINRSNDELLVAQIYVYDIVFGVTSSDFALSFTKEMKTEFKMSMVGELTFFLGLQIRQLKTRIFISQSKYARKFGLESSKHFGTPMSTTIKLSKDVFRKDVEQKFYRSMIGSLLYLTMSRLDISFTVEACAKYQANPKESHLTTVKRIICYLNETLDYSLWYPYGYSFVIVGYFDVDWVENVEDKKKHIWCLFFYC